MFFASDNAGPAHPSIAEALVHANTGYQMPYGKDTIMDQVRDRLRTIFEAPEAAIYLVATGTAANSLSLATYCQPWQTVFCSPVAHINEDECNSPEFYMGGAKLTLVGDSDKMTPAALRAAMGHDARIAVHSAQPGPLSITQATEKGRIYTCDEIAALSAIAADLGQPTHLDGARFANALVALGCTPAEMTWKAGVDVVSFGGTKNGCVGVEAVIFFDPAKAWEFELRRKRGAHLFSKHRYLSAQMLAYLEGGLWLDLAKRSNARMALLADGLRKIPGTSFLHDPQANIVFANLPRAAHKRLMQAGARYYLTSGDLDGADEDELLTARLVCDWSLPEAEITRFLEIAAG
ncbi:low specificity L-threonine aldolase [Pseudooceanicola sediminis]|uniref:Low specificity L-threonine aldolase n=1 Tax=Pseudooceanicola sediminis TaxID=2211117 RepID=A0A399J7T4_9RHOB|nr:beta-eliminating lyase-related protein [Pseudooceanicola sediminis]KAA2313984.1 low specificity L-threonine aldolase [Puniceibacterium sp. HSS470]RII38796.1 low specificity L-threonine aldolase [Pseudooceanicola sediminis]|tara:strand:+ start:118645 stop:119691 length:1047 start_codon:yes stop_codon:yes gene_type:complete